MKTIGLLAAALALGLAACGTSTPANTANPVAANAVRPLDNNCSGGYVTFTWDGGPKLADQQGDTPLVLGTLQKLHLKAVFFVIGTAVVTEPQIVREEVKDGDSVQNHTWDHGDLTGQSTHAKPMTAAQVRSELVRGANAITAAGAPKPTLWRPPFDDVTLADNAIATSLGERIVLSYGDPASKIIDSGDWTGLSGAQIAHNVIHGSYNEQHNWVPGLQAGSIIGYHDGIPGKAPVNAADSLQPIVDHMNAEHLCSTINVPNPADGGVFLPNGGFPVGSPG